MMMDVCLAVLLAQDPSAETLKRLAAELPDRLKAADADGNGTLDAKEFRRFRPVLKQAADKILGELDPSIAKKKTEKDLKKHDANKDGKLDEAEAKARDEAERLKDIQDFDWDEDGTLNERERTAMAWAEEGKLDKRFRRADGDANGALTLDEARAALPDLAGIKVKKTE